MATKSGSRNYHGTAWEYVRNNDFDAKNYFTNLNGQPQPPLRFNVYGWNLGGPVFIPKIYPKSKSKTFFFFNEEWRKLRQSSIFNVPTPSLAERTGDFSALLPKTPLKDPDNGTADSGEHYSSKPAGSERPYTGGTELSVSAADEPQRQLHTIVQRAH